MELNLGSASEVDFLQPGHDLGRVNWGNLVDLGVEGRVDLGLDGGDGQQEDREG